MNVTGQCVAVAGKCGLAHCTLYARKWKLFGNETQACFVIVQCSLDLYAFVLCLQCFDAVGWTTGRASGL